MIVTSDRFTLHRGVSDVESGLEAGHDGLKHLLTVVGTINEDMTGGAIEARGDGPYVQVMDIDDAWELQELIADCVDTEAGGCDF